jgi:putative heme-binding domain-containing protein
MNHVALFPHLRSPCYCLFALLIALACCPNDAEAIDESESLVLLVKTLNVTEDASIRAALMRGMLSGLEGRRNVAAPNGWSELSTRLATSNDQNVRNLSNQLSQIFGDRAAMQRALTTLRDTSAEPGARRTALRSLLTQQNKEASSLLESLLDEPALTLDAIRGYAIVENAIAPAVLLGRYAKSSEEHRRAVIETLATRKSYAEALLTAIKQKTVSRDDIPVHVARSLDSILGERFVKVFGKVRTVSADREKLMAKYRKMLTPAAITTADASRGRAVFKKTCASCHVLYDDGGKIGPDLTGSNRANLDYILLNSIDPSYDVPASYKMVSIVTVAGRVLNGVLAEEDATRVVLKTVEQPRVVILKEDIDERHISPKSMMPDGQFDKMKQQEVLDLIKYLRTTEQVEPPQ